MHDPENSVKGFYIFHRGPYGPPLASPGGPISVFLSKPIATCDFQGEGQGPHPLPTTPLDLPMWKLTKLQLLIFLMKPIWQNVEY